MSDALKELASMREVYREGALRRRDLKACPLEQFSNWMNAAEKANLSHPNACTLATTDSAGQPSARAILLKGIEDGGFVFYTNFGSRKAVELDDNPRSVLHFPWWVMQRQVSVEGCVQRMDEESAERYFRSRPLDSRFGAWASRQSEVLDSRETLENAFDEMVERFGGDPPKPSFWGGFRMMPKAIEFWQGRPGRLHDRFLYRQKDDKAWTIERLYP